MTPSDWIGIAGLVVTIAGFGLTIYQLRRTTSAAEAAQKAVAELRSRLTQVNTIADLAGALNALDEIKRLHYAEAWPQLPERCLTLRRLLVSIDSTNPELNEDDKSTIQSVILHLRTLENRVDRGLSTKGGTLPAKANSGKVLSEQADKLHDLLVRLKQEAGS